MNPFCAHPFALAYLVRFAQTGPGDGCIVRFSPPNGSAVCTHTDTHKHMHVHSRTAKRIQCLFRQACPSPRKRPKSWVHVIFTLFSTITENKKPFHSGSVPATGFAISDIRVQGDSGASSGKWEPTQKKGGMKNIKDMNSHTHPHKTPKWFSFVVVLLSIHFD